MITMLLVTAFLTGLLLQLLYIIQFCVKITITSLWRLRGLQSTLFPNNKPLISVAVSVCILSMVNQQLHTLYR